MLWLWCSLLDPCRLLRSLACRRRWAWNRLRSLVCWVGSRHRRSLVCLVWNHLHRSLVCWAGSRRHHHSLACWASSRHPHSSACWALNHHRNRQMACRHPSLLHCHYGHRRPHQACRFHSHHPIRSLACPNRQMNRRNFQIPNRTILSQSLNLVGCQQHLGLVSRSCHHCHHLAGRRLEQSWRTGG